MKKLYDVVFIVQCSDCEGSYVRLSPITINSHIILIINCRKIDTFYFENVALCFKEMFQIKRIEKSINNRNTRHFPHIYNN